MYFDDIQVVRSRRTDPATSHAAAKKAERFIPTHKAQILEALIEGPRTAQGIAAMTGLTVVQVDRRLCELERADRTNTWRRKTASLCRSTAIAC
jgi:predicted Rossmann fold nucleotide-binding protein DprA/Smf involved in DNA uptake